MIQIGQMVSQDAGLLSPQRLLLKSLRTGCPGIYLGFAFVTLVLDPQYPQSSGQ